MMLKKRTVSEVISRQKKGLLRERLIAKRAALTMEIVSLTRDLGLQEVALPDPVATQKFIEDLQEHYRKEIVSLSGFKRENDLLRTENANLRVRLATANGTLEAAYAMWTDLGKVSSMRLFQAKRANAAAKLTEDELAAMASPVAPPKPAPTMLPIEEKLKEIVGRVPYGSVGQIPAEVIDGLRVLFFGPEVKP